MVALGTIKKSVGVSVGCLACVGESAKLGAFPSNTASWDAESDACSSRASRISALRNGAPTDAMRCSPGAHNPPDHLVCGV